MKNQIKKEYMPFAEKLREALKQKGMSQKEAAEKIGVQQTTISFYCCGRSSPDVDKTRRLEDLLDLEPGSLLRALSSVKAQKTKRESQNSTPPEKLKKKTTPPPKTRRNQLKKK